MPSYADNHWLLASIQLHLFVKKQSYFGCALNAVHYRHAEVGEHITVGDALQVGLSQVIQGLLACNKEIAFMIDINATKLEHGLHRREDELLIVNYHDSVLRVLEHVVCDPDFVVRVLLLPNLDLGNDRSILIKSLFVLSCLLLYLHR
jgi:hypothetical protein